MGDVLVALIFKIPGAFIRWGLTGFKKGKFQNLINENTGLNGLVFILLFISIGLILLYFK